MKKFKEILSVLITLIAILSLIFLTAVFTRILIKIAMDENLSPFKATYYMSIFIIYIFTSSSGVFKLIKILKERQ